MGKLSIGSREYRNHLLATLAICAAFLLCLQTANLAGYATEKESTNAVPVLVLTQRHNFLGDNRITIADDAVRMQNLGRLGFILVAKKPDWKVVIYRNDDKTIFRESLAEFSDTGLCSDMVASRHDRNLEGNQRVTDSKLGRFASKRAIRQGRVIEYLPLGKISPQIENVLFAAYKTPTNGGIPLYFSKQTTGSDWLTGMRDKDRHREILSTESVKTDFVSPSCFDVPGGLSTVKAAQEVICSKANRAGADDFGDLFAIGAKAKNK